MLPIVDFGFSFSFATAQPKVVINYVTERSARLQKMQLQVWPLMSLNIFNIGTHFVSKIIVRFNEAKLMS